jgi:nucleoside-diphosphate-sugar epimerase
VLSKADSPSEVERAGIRAIREAESDLRRRCERSNTPLAILRPTLIYGCGLDDNVSRIHRWIRRFGFFPVAGDAQGLRQPLHADDLAEVSVALLATDFGRYFESPVCGASTLSFDEMVARVGAAAGSDHRGLRVPMALLSGTAWLTDVILRGPHSRREMVRRQARDLVFDDSRLRTMTGVAAREFAPVARDFTLPVP